MALLSRLTAWVRDLLRRAAEPVPDETWEQADADGRIW